MFEEKTFESIRLSILQELGLADELSRVEGTYTSDVVSACALEISKVYAYLNSLFNAMFPNENSGEYLHRRALDFGLTPKAATPATASVMLRGTESVTIPAGKRLVSTGGIAFTLDTAVTVTQNRSVSAAITAAQPGRVWVRANSLAFDPAISGVTVTHGDILAGTDVESDEALYRRLQLRLQEPPASGTAADYKRWALEVPGIGYAKVRLQSNGVILIMTATPDLERPSDQVLNAAQAHIDELRPIGAIAAVRWTLRQGCQISAKVTLTGEATVATVQEQFAATMAERIKEIAFDEETDSMTLARITHILMSTPGVADVPELLINGRAENWVFGLTAIPTIESITIAEAT